MPRQFFKPLTALLVTGITLLISCKKEEQNVLTEENELQNKVIKWLDSKKSDSQPNKASNIELLKGNLDFSKIKIETFVDGDQLIIIPINRSYKKGEIPDSYSLLNLVLINDSKNIIKNGRIAIFTPNSNDILNSIPNNTFSKILKLEPIDCNGSFTFLSITGQLLHKYEYRKGKIHSFGEVRNQSPSPNRTELNSSVNSNCTDWYIVTTYYVDGIPVNQDYQFIGTTCEGCDDSNLQSICPDDGGTGGSGGGGSNDVIETSNVSSTKEESDETDALAGAAPKIRYQYNAQIVRTNGYVTSVIVYPTTIANAHEVYIDRYGRNTTRILTVYGHNNSWTSLGTTAMIYWSCFVYGRWIYTEGSPEYNRTWTDTHTAVR